MGYWTAPFSESEADSEEEGALDQDADFYQQDTPGRTLDGLRKRIPGIHEGYPPDGMGLDDHDDLS
ncbi:MAG: hypothetical protein WC029_02925 [Sulfuricella sp.]|jgi:hypothetical protein